jgi:hypothetical protein
MSCRDFSGDLEAWPNCVVADCPFKSCLSLRSDKCYGHTLGLPIPDPDEYFSRGRRSGPSDRQGSDGRGIKP